MKTNENRCSSGKYFLSIDHKPMVGSHSTWHLRLESGKECQARAESRMSTSVSIMTEDKHLVLSLYDAYSLSHEGEMSGKMSAAPIGFLALYPLRSLEPHTHKHLTCKTELVGTSTLQTKIAKWFRSDLEPLGSVKIHRPSRCWVDNLQ